MVSIRNSPGLNLAPIHYGDPEMRAKSIRVFLRFASIFTLISLLSASLSIVFPILSVPKDTSHSSSIFQPYSLKERK